MRFIQHILSSRLHLLWPVLTGLAAAYVLAGAVEHQVAPESELSPQADTASLAPDEDEPAWEALIMEKNIMDLEIPSQEPVAERDPEPGASPTDWKLLGTYTGGQEFALVEIQDRTRLLDRGEKEQGWKLSQIEPRSTLWKSGSRTETLVMWADENERGEGQDNGERTRARGPAQDSGQQDSRKVTLSREEARHFLEDPNQLLQTALFEPYTQEGEMLGFRIDNISDGTILQELGLQDGDILTRIDGQSISGPQEFMQAYSSLGQSSLVSMDVKREGENVNFLLEID